MPDAHLHTEQLRHWLARMQAGDDQAREELLRHAGGRLERLTRKMLRRFPGVQRWAQTDDVLQNALLRLLRALREVQPDSTRAFFSLAGVQIRRELLDLARHYFGPRGAGAHHASNADASGHKPIEPADPTNDPSDLADWCELHEQVEKLPDEEREIVDLLFYQGLTQSAAASLLDINVRTVQRRWHAALLKLHRVLKDVDR